MSDLAATLSKPVGPLPVYGWAVALAGGVGVAVLVRRRALSTDAGDAAPDVAPDDLSINGGEGEVITATRPGVGNTYQPGVYGEGEYDDVERPQDNTEWVSVAASKVALSGMNGTLAVKYLTMYVRGEAIPQDGEQYVTRAINLVGAPPTLITPKTPTTVKTPAKPAPAKPAPKPAGRFKTNAQWYAAAKAYLKTRRISEHDYKVALNTYLGRNGTDMYREDASIVQAAIGKLGLPPQKTAAMKRVKVSQRTRKEASKQATRRDTGKR